MKRFFILLRGIMPVGKNKVPLASLKALLIQHGFQQIKAYIHTGNILLRSLLRVKIVYLVATILLIALSFIAYFQITHLIDSTNQLNHAYKVSHSLKKIAKTVVDAGSNHKSYLLTGDVAMLAKRDLDFTTINYELNVLDSLTKFHSEQNVNVRILRGLINQKILNFKLMFETYQPMQIEPDFRLSITDEFRQTENLIHEINEMSALEHRQLELKTDHYARLAFTAPILNIILSLGALIILFISYLRIATALEHSHQLKAELEASNIELAKKNDELLKGGEQFLKIFDNNPVAMAFAETSNNHVVYANNLFYKQFGYTSEEVIGHTTDELNLVSADEKERLQSALLNGIQENRSIAELQTIPEEERIALLLKMREKMFEKGFEVLYTRKDGTTFYAIVFYEVIDIANKNYVLASYQDISEIKKVSFQLEEKNIALAKINKELESINYISSHDLQEPLRQIQVFASRISENENHNLSANGIIYFEKMNNAAKRMQNLISDLLTFSRFKTELGKFETTNLNQIIDRVIEEFAEIIEEKQAIIKTEDLGDAKVIPFQFRQMMYNLIGNALKFSKPDTPPHIIIKNIKVTTSQVPGADPESEEEFHHISISDNGIGFEEEYKDRIFEVFQRLQSKQKVAGTGIGLAIVKNIVENHHGIIHATGEPNHGATFDIYIPINPAI